MEIITNLLNNWTTYEKVNTLILLLIILIAVPGLVWLFTKQSRMAINSLLSLIITGALVLLTFIITNTVLSIAITYTFKLIPFIVLLMNIMCIGTMAGYYMQKHKHKDYSNKAMLSEVQKDAINLTVFTILLFSSFAVLTASILLPILLSLGLSLLVIWIHYLLLRGLLK